VDRDDVTRVGEHLHLIFETSSSGIYHLETKAPGDGLDHRVIGDDPNGGRSPDHEQSVLARRIALRNI